MHIWGELSAFQELSSLYSVSNCVLPDIKEHYHHTCQLGWNWVWLWSPDCFTWHSFQDIGQTQGPGQVHLCCQTLNQVAAISSDSGRTSPQGQGFSISSESTHTHTNEGQDLTAKKMLLENQVCNTAAVDFLLREQCCRYIKHVKQISTYSQVNWKDV